MQAKRVKDSLITIVYQMTHQDANLAGNVHGGVILKNIDNTAGIVAARHANTSAVTASIDRVDFYSPVYVGDLLRLLASVNYTGTTSMEIGVRVEAENFMTGEVRHTASAYLSFVALDAEGKPTKVPRIILITIRGIVIIRGRLSYYPILFASILAFFRPSRRVCSKANRAAGASSSGSALKTSSNISFNSSLNSGWLKM
jgi:acyl-CoA hydrolase